MTAEAQQIISILSEYLIKNPAIRFTEALHDLKINQFQYTTSYSPIIRDPYNDLDLDVLERIKKQLENNSKVIHNSNICT